MCKQQAVARGRRKGASGRETSVPDTSMEAGRGRSGGDKQRVCAVCTRYLRVPTCARFSIHGRGRQESSSGGIYCKR